MADQGAHSAVIPFEKTPRDSETLKQMTGIHTDTTLALSFETLCNSRHCPVKKNYTTQNQQIARHKSRREVYLGRERERERERDIYIYI